MDNRLTMIYYKGYWEDGNKFVDYDFRGMQFPKDNNYTALLRILYNQL